MYVAEIYNFFFNKRLSYHRETRATLCVSWNVIFLCANNANVCQSEEHFQQLPVFIQPPAWFCTRIIAVCSTMTQRACDTPCHIHNICWSEPCLWSMTTNVLSTVLQQLRSTNFDYHQHCWWHSVFLCQCTLHLLKVWWRSVNRLWQKQRSRAHLCKLAITSQWFAALKCTEYLQDVEGTYRVSVWV